MQSNQPEKVIIALPKAEALVLFELLSRMDDNKQPAITDPAEQVALNNLLCLLERELSEPFLPNYGEIWEAAKTELRNHWIGKEEQNEKSSE
jgi:hypothetical protein